MAEWVLGFYAFNLKLEDSPIDSASPGITINLLGYELHIKLLSFCVNNQRKIGAEHINLYTVTSE